jgi:hypothetical protein
MPLPLARNALTAFSVSWEEGWVSNHGSSLYLEESSAIADMARYAKEYEKT